MFKKALIAFMAAVVVTLSSPIVAVYLEKTNDISFAQDTGLDSGSFMFDLSTVTHEGITGTTRQKFSRGGINYIFERVITFMAATIGGMSVLFMSIGGLMIMTSFGNDGQISKGKTFIKYSLIGLAFSLGAYVIVTAVQLLIASIYA